MMIMEKNNATMLILLILTIMEVFFAMKSENKRLRDNYYRINVLKTL